MGFIIFGVIVGLLGLIPASIAGKKGRDPLTWWIYGSLLFIIALVHALVIKPTPAALEKQLLDDGMTKCPKCAEFVKPEAIKCKHCGNDLVPAPAPPSQY